MAPTPSTILPSTTADRLACNAKYFLLARLRINGPPTSFSFFFSHFLPSSIFYPSFLNEPPRRSAPSILVGYWVFRLRFVSHVCFFPEHLAVSAAPFELSFRVNTPRSFSDNGLLGKERTWTLEHSEGCSGILSEMIMILCDYLELLQRNCLSIHVFIYVCLYFLEVAGYSCVVRVGILSGDLYRCTFAKDRNSKFGITT